MLKPLVLLAICATLFQGCKKEDDDGDVASVDIQFRTDSGYVSHDDTVGFSDTLRVVMIAAEGADDLVTFLLSVSYDGATPVGTDTLGIPVNPFLFDKTIITRNVAGTERWRFTVVEGDGDATSRSLTFVTQP